MRETKRRRREGPLQTDQDRDLSSLTMTTSWRQPKGARLKSGRSDACTARCGRMPRTSIRVVRGAGKPYEVAQDCAAIVEALHGYNQAFGYWPLPEVVSQALNIDRPVDWAAYPNEGLRLEGNEAVIRGALQVAASRLAGQRTQEMSGSNEIQHGGPTF